jgi:transposase
MSRIRSVNLSESAREELEKGYREDKNSTFSRRCHIILLKSQARSSKEVAAIVGTNQLSVNQWLDRYEAEGIEGLKTRAGRGRKPLLDEIRDAQAVRKAVQSERQRLKHAKESLEQELGKRFSLKTLQRFLKNLSADGNAFL